MRILDLGHCYELSHLDGNDVQTLTFVKRLGSNYPGNESNYEGTTCQEVIRALIDRCQYLQKQKPCAETLLINRLLTFALFLFEFRHARIKGRIIFPFGILQRPVCKHCGHIVCDFLEKQKRR